MHAYTYIHVYAKETDSRGRTVAKRKTRAAYSMRTHGVASAAKFEALRNY